MKKPNNWGLIGTEEAIRKLGFIEFLDSGFPYFSPIGERIRSRIEDFISCSCEDHGFAKINIPSTHSRDIVEGSGRYDQYEKEFFSSSNGFVHRASSEEYMMRLAMSGLESYSQLPARFFSISTAVRFVERPKGIQKLREFGGAVLTSFEVDQEGYEASLNLFNRLVVDVLDQLQIPHKTNEKRGGIEFLYDPLEKMKDLDGLSIAMGYKYEPLMGDVAKFTSRSNTSLLATIGTFGIGIERLMLAIADSCRDYSGFNFPERVRPFDEAIIPVETSDEHQNEMADKIYSESNTGRRTYIDDRRKVTYKQRMEYADLLGVPKKLVIGKKEVASGVPTTVYRRIYH